MSMTDPISDYLTRIRNAQKDGHTKVDIPASNIKRNLTRILLQHQLIKNYINVDDGLQGRIRIYLRYETDLTPLIKGLRRISRPGCRVYVNHEKIPRVLNNLGLAIMSTSHGVMTNKEAQRRGLGGEVLCYVW